MMAIYTPIVPLYYLYYTNAPLALLPQNLNVQRGLLLLVLTVLLGAFSSLEAGVVVDEFQPFKL